MRCDLEKTGKFGKLRCCRERGHEGSCNYVVIGVAEWIPAPGRKRTRSDVAYARGRARKAAAKAKE